MDFLTKLETLINNFIMRFFEGLINRIKKKTPPFIANGLKKLVIWKTYLVTNFKILPSILKTLVLKWLVTLKVFISGIDFRAKLNETYGLALKQYKSQSKKGKSKAQTMLMAPFLLVGQWLKGLSAGQTMLLLGFSAASFLAGINMVFTGHRMLGQQSKTSSRSPASVEEDEALKYDRPGYYKRQMRHFQVTNFRLPVYFAQVNEIKSVDIDFNATLSNRQSKKFLEKHEFHLRDHLILQIEPLVASFPLQDEGKEVIKDKIEAEINNFLKENKIEGHVQELMITYVLAN